MKNAMTALAVALAVCACGEEAPSPAVQESAQAISNGFVFDHAALEQRPSGLLPRDRLRPEAFAPQHVIDALIETDEDFDDSASLSKRTVAQSPNWIFEQSPDRGRVLVLSRAAGGRARPLVPGALRQASLERLERFGIPADEVGRVLQRAVKRQDRDAEGQVGAPEVHRHKTFVWRGVDGVRVEGHRAVVTHRPDGGFHRALIKWPALAGDGHRLRSDLPVGEIEQRAVAALQAAGESRGSVQTRWLYVPTLRADGSVTLELKVSARLAEEEHGDYTEEARLIEVEVDAR